uniref:Putative cup n=1 Tax=Corethrella appendiculata TaxID=1370023 RepID=U5EQS9_9DIPT
MVKIFVNENKNIVILNNEQRNDCSKLVLKADEPPLESLDPAILSCGLPAIILANSNQSTFSQHQFQRTRYTRDELMEMQQSPLCKRRPNALNDPRLNRFLLWKSSLSAGNSCENLNADGKKSAQNALSFDDFKSFEYQRSSYQNRDRRPYGHNRNNIQTFGNYETQQIMLSVTGDPVKDFRYEPDSISRFERRNHDFGGRNNYAIVKKYNSNQQQQYNNQLESVIEEEPEWVSAGPTSRLDTIELRGFDDDDSISKETLSSSGLSADKDTSSGKDSEKKTSFYDELHHYEYHRRSKNQQNTSNGDTESVATSSHASPPPARSTPTKIDDFNNNNAEIFSAEELFVKSSSASTGNFDEMLKLDASLNANDAKQRQEQSQSQVNDEIVSKFNEWFPFTANQFRGNNNNLRNSKPDQQQINQDSYRSASLERHRYNSSDAQQQMYFQQQQQSSSNPTTDNQIAFKKLLDLIANNKARTNAEALMQQQHLMQILTKNQESDFLMRLIQQKQQTQQQEQSINFGMPNRMPTHRELQQHTQTIMQNALLRKKIQEQRKILYESSILQQQQQQFAGGTGNAFDNNQHLILPSVDYDLNNGACGAAGQRHVRFNQGSLNSTSSSSSSFGGGQYHQQQRHHHQYNKNTPHYQRRRQYFLKNEYETEGNVSNNNSSSNNASNNSEPENRNPSSKWFSGTEGGGSSNSQSQESTTASNTAAENSNIPIINID